MLKGRELSARRRTRLAASAYSGRPVFVTICTFQRRHLFGIVRPNARETRVELSVVGEIVRQEWTTHCQRASRSLDAFAVMPDHLHGIVWLGAIPLGEFVGRLKSAVSSRVEVETDETLQVWQRGYYDRIIRDEKELAATRAYIADNPSRWTFHL